MGPKLESLADLSASQCRVLSVQSHVVSGYVGNKCAVFPLQLHEFEVDSINSVQFSNHTGYGHWKGQILDSSQLVDLFNGLKLNGLDHYTHMLTGYVAEESFLRQIAAIVRDLRNADPRFFYICDPVMGDNDSFYVPEALLPIYRDEIIPLANVITPNQFELGKLSGIVVHDESSAMAAIMKLHKLGVHTIVVTSSNLASSSDIMYCYASKYAGDDHAETYRFEIKRLPAVFVGTGDVFTSLLLIWLHKSDYNVRKAVEMVLATIQDVLKFTLQEAYKCCDGQRIPTSKDLELRLIQSHDILLHPSMEISVTDLSTS